MNDCVFSLLECLIANIATEGLGPCKRASQANHGTIDILMPAADQTAVIAITAGSPVNTRIKLVCTAITDASIYTVREFHSCTAVTKEYFKNDLNNRFPPT